MISFKQYLLEQNAKDAEYKTRVFRVPVDHLSYLEDKIKQLNKKAVKLGTKPNRIILNKREMEEIPRNRAEEEANRPKKFREFQYLTIEGEIPVLAGGWAFVGKLEPHEAGTIVKSAPGHKLPVKFQKANPYHCDHCNKLRNRKETFIVKKGSKHIQVGRSCLKDFLGHADPEKYASYAEYIHNIEDELRGMEDNNWGGKKWDPLWSTEQALTAAHAAIRRDGFKGTQSEGLPTKSTMFDHFLPPTGSFAKHYVPLKITDQDSNDAKATINWIKEKAKTDKSEFFQNLAKFASVEANSPKYFGYLAAAAMMYQKEQGNIVAKKKLSDGIKDEPIGKEGDKVKLEAEVIGAHTYQRQSYSYYDSGVSQVLTLKDKDGHLIKMFSSNMDVKMGNKVNISGKLGKCEPETYESSPFKGKHITMMAPRSRINVIQDTSEYNDDRSLNLKQIKSIKGVAVPANITGMDKMNSDKLSVTYKFYSIEKPQGFERTFKWDEIEFNS